MNSILRKATTSIQSAAQSFSSTLVQRTMQSPRTMRAYLNAWPPLLGSGIRLTQVDETWSKARIELKISWWNANMHGAAFGGTLFAMTDVLFGTLVARHMGKTYEAWTRTGTFQFLQPGRDGAYLDVEISPELSAWMHKTVEEDGYANVPYTSVIKNKDGSIVGIGQQDLHVRKRGSKKRVPEPEQAKVPRGLILESLATALVWESLRDNPAELTQLMSAQRRIPDPGDQIKHVVSYVLDKTDTTKEDILKRGIPEIYLPE